MVMMMVMVMMLMMILVMMMIVMGTGRWVLSSAALELKSCNGSTLPLG